MKQKPGPWEVMFRTLRHFQRTHGHCDVPPNRREDSLYRWLKTQRERYAASGLHVRQMRKLKSIGALQPLNGWAEHAAEIFEDHFKRLKKFKKQYGHCHVPINWSKDGKLARWLSTQRQNYRKGKLLPERAERLRKLGVAWKVRGMDRSLLRIGSQPFEKWWDEHFRNIQKWKHTNFMVPLGKNETLRRWALTQRTDYKKGTLRADRRKRLEEIGFVWKPQSIPEARWEAMFERLVAFKKRFGHPQVPMTWSEDSKLGNWVATQREFLRHGKLSKDRFHRLSKLGLSWEVSKELDRTAMRLTGSHYREHEDLWERRFNALRKWKDKQLQLTARTDYTLYRWIVWQRKAYRAGLLRADRQKRLEKLGFPMVAPDQTEPKWEKRFEQLVVFKKRHGHFNVSSRQNLQLLGWIERQRKLYKSGRILPHRRRRLEEIGFSWTDQKEETWNRLFEELCKWKKRNFKVPVTVQPLQTWGNHQRRMHRKGRLRKDRYRRLKEIGFPFEV